MLLGVALLGSAALAGAQSWPNRSYGYGQDRSYGYGQNQGRDDRVFYNRGFQQGQYDALHNRRSQFSGGWGTDPNDRRAWERGYNEGFRQARNSYGNGGYGNGYPNGGYYGSGNGYPNAGYGYGNLAQARNIGYNDGLNDGRVDRQTGHSFRPTQGDNFKNADRGYNSSFGDRQTYKDTYRQGYQQGYQLGYNGNGYYGR
jgi:hypothetical protein